jgi:DNA-binding MarR family transcriptional regulator
MKLGLTEYEARIYSVLVKLGPKKAGEISFFSKVPRPKTYGALRELQRKGLIEVLPENLNLIVNFLQEKHEQVFLVSRSRDQQILECFLRMARACAISTFTPTSLLLLVHAYALMF